MSTLIYRKFPKPVHRVFVLLTVGLAGFISFQSLTPVRVNIDANNMDKLVHFLAYFCLASVALPGFSRFNPASVLSVVIGFGALIEVLQGLGNVGRTADILDFFANTLGALCAYLVWFILSRFGEIFAHKE